MSKIILPLRRLVALFAVAFLAAQPAFAAKFFVNSKLGDVPAEAKVKVEKPKPVQFLFEFQTSGVANPRATKAVKPMIIEAMKQQGVFADFVDTPVPDGAVLNIQFNNIPEKGAAKKGLGAGLTFGLAGVYVTDFYEVHFDYVPATGQPPISTDVKHALHMKMGNKKVEDPGIPVKNALEAVKMVVAQASAHGLNQIAADPRFPK